MKMLSFISHHRLSVLMTVILCGTLFLSSCKDRASEQFESDQVLIEEYKALNNLDSMLVTESGLHYRIFNQQTVGNHPTVNSVVTINYSGQLTNGEIFDFRDLWSTPLTGVILGWREAVPLMKIGEQMRLIIPSELAYGGGIVGGIPPNSILVFEIELIDFY